MKNSEKLGIIFDMDGVLVDSERVIEAAAIAGLNEYGIQAKSEDFVPFIGAGEDKYIGGVSEKYGITYRVDMKTRVYEIYLNLVSAHLKVYDGTLELLEKLKKENYVLALASSADAIKIEANLRVAGILPHVFTTIISGQDVVNKKPSPEIYLLASNKIHISPTRCVVIEDALNGIQAAKSAGIKCIGVATSFKKEVLKKEGADFVCDHISQVYDIIKGFLNYE